MVHAMKEDSILYEIASSLKKEIKPKFIQVLRSNQQTIEQQQK